MGTILEFLRRVRFLFQGSRFDQDLADEMRLHLDLRAENKRDGGLDPALSQASARRQFGNVTQMQEASRDAWTFAFVGENLSNSHAAVFTSTDEFTVAETPLRPRTLGVTASWKF